MKCSTNLVGGSLVISKCVHRINNQEQSGLLIFIIYYKFRLCLLWLENGNQFSKIMIIALIKVKMYYVIAEGNVRRSNKMTYVKPYNVKVECGKYEEISLNYFIIIYIIGKALRKCCHALLPFGTCFLTYALIFSPSSWVEDTLKFLPKSSLKK